MLDLIFAAEVGIFVEDGVVGMGISGHDGLEGCARERGNVRFRQQLVKAFLADPPPSLPAFDSPS